MKRIAQSLVLLIIALVSGLLLYRAAAPRLLPPIPVAEPSASLPPSSARHETATASVPVLPDAPIAPPKSTQQHEAQSIETRRRPYYRWLREKFGDVLEDERPSSGDSATLDLTTSRYDPQLVLYLVAHAVQPNADQFGFDHVRIFQPNPPGSLERVKFDSEASPDGNGIWHAFAK